MHNVPPLLISQNECCSFTSQRLCVSASTFINIPTLDSQRRENERTDIPSVLSPPIRDTHSRLESLPLAWAQSTHPRSLFSATSQPASRQPTMNPASDSPFHLPRVSRSWSESLQESGKQWQIFLCLRELGQRHLHGRIVRNSGMNPLLRMAWFKPGQRPDSKVTNAHAYRSFLISRGR